MVRNNNLLKHHMEAVLKIVILPNKCGDQKPLIKRGITEKPNEKVTQTKNTMYYAKVCN